MVGYLRPSDFEPNPILSTYAAKIKTNPLDPILSGNVASEYDSSSDEVSTPHTSDDEGGQSKRKEKGQARGMNCFG